MKNITILFIGLLLAYSMNAQDLSLDEVLANYYEVNGLESLDRHKTFIMKGKSVSQGMENNFTMTILKPDKYRMDVPIQGQNMVQVYNAGEAWMIAPWTGSLDPKDITGDQVKQMEKQSDLTGDLYNWKEKGNKVEMLENEDFEGSPVYRIKCIDKNEDESIYFIDAENFVVLKQENTTMMRGEEVKTATFPSDYKPVGDFMMPHNFEVAYNEQVVSQILIEEVVLDPEIDESIFEKPEPSPAAGTSEDK
jgi:outer membrane lipoprotein-sorting protein